MEERKVKPPWIPELSATVNHTAYVFMYDLLYVLFFMLLWFDFFQTLLEMGYRVTHRRPLRSSKSVLIIQQ